MEINQDRRPNFREDGKLYLVRCYACSPHGRENCSFAVASGECSWCGWKEADAPSKPGSEGSAAGGGK